MQTEYYDNEQECMLRVVTHTTTMTWQWNRDCHTLNCLKLHTLSQQPDLQYTRRMNAYEQSNELQCFFTSTLRVYRNTSFCWLQLSLRWLLYNNHLHTLVSGTFACKKVSVLPVGFDQLDKNARQVRSLGWYRRGEWELNDRGDEQNRSTW